MTADDIRALYAYNRWANVRSLDAAAQVEPEPLARNLGNSFGSLRETLAHILAAEWIWLERWLGRETRVFPKDILGCATVDELRARRVPVERELDAFLAALTPERLAAEVAYHSVAGKPFREPLWVQMQHVVNHSTYHRGQVTTLLRQLGAAPVATDLIAFYREGAPKQLPGLTPSGNCCFTGLAARAT